MATTFIVDCPVCKAKVAVEETGRTEHTGFDDNASEPYGRRLSLGKCPRCETLLVGESRQLQFDGWEGDESDIWSEPVRVYPKPPKTFSSFRIPNSVVASLTEGDNALQASAQFAACVMFGRALEAVCRDILFTEDEKKKGKGKKPPMLAAGIKLLREKNIIDDRLYDWSQHLRAFRNLAAHPSGDGATILRQDAEDLQAFVYAIIEYIYDLADRYEEFKNRQKKRAAKQKPPDEIAPS